MLKMLPYIRDEYYGLIKLIEQQVKILEDNNIVERVF